jgi:RNase P/RNase MRP subunit POP5
VASGDASFDAARALETALRRALFSAHGVVGGGSVATEVLEATTTRGDDGENGGGSKPIRDPPNATLISEEDTEEENTKILHLVGVVKAPRDAERKIASALALCRHPERARVVARADDLVALGMDARALMRRAVRGERGERER